MKNENSLAMSKKEREKCTCSRLLWSHTVMRYVSIYSSCFLIWKPVHSTWLSDNFQDIFKTVHCWARWGSEGFISPTSGVCFWEPLKSAKIFATNQVHCMIHNEKLAPTMGWVALATWLGALWQYRSLGWLNKLKSFFSCINVYNVTTSSYTGNCHLVF